MDWASVTTAVLAGLVGGGGIVKVIEIVRTQRRTDKGFDNTEKRTEITFAEDQLRKLIVDQTTLLDRRDKEIEELRESLYDALHKAAEAEATILKLNARLEHYEPNTNRVPVSQPPAGHP